MKNHYNFIQKPLSLLIGFLLATLFYGCQQDSIDFAQDPVDLKVNSDIDSKARINGLTEAFSLQSTLEGGAAYEIALPLFWNSIPDGQRVMFVYAHGYVDPGEPIELPSDLIPDGLGGAVAIKDIILEKGGYASTSYRDNGLVVLDAIKDIKELKMAIDEFFADPENPALPYDAIFLVGPSEGGMITVLTIEQNPGMFAAAIATCCPIGDFYKQLQYYGDAHVLFKYFFGPSIKGINLGSPKGVSKHTMEAWRNNGPLYLAIKQELEDDYQYNGGNKIRQFLNTSGIGENVDRSDPPAVVNAILEVLRFPIMATNDAIERLGGSPYNNKDPKRIYEGSDDDRKLNLTVERIKRSEWETSSQNVANFYETTGNLLTPLVNMHTEFDHVALYWHQTYYAAKVGGVWPSSFLYPIKINQRYGHCNFNKDEILGAINALLILLQQS